MTRRPKILVSGGFDPLHSGHLRMIGFCATLGEVIVALNTDEWLVRKKGFCLQDYATRFDIMYNLGGVSDVVMADDFGDETCLMALNDVEPDVFANGGDRLPDNTPEVKYCIEHDIALLFNAGGEKVASSTEILENAIKQREAAKDHEGGMS